MKARALASLAALSLLTSPVAVQAARPAEIELHIEATAQVPPDRAVVGITISGAGPTEDAAHDKLRKAEDELLKALASNGIDPAHVKARSAAADTDTVMIEAADEGAACAAEDATNAAMDAAASPKKIKRRTVLKCDATPPKTVTKILMVSLDDPAKLDVVQMLMGDDYAYGRLRPVYSQRDPVAARKKARAEALAKANAEADAYAEALGYRVVRIVRVSNAKPSINLPDMFSFFGNMEDRSGRMQPSWFSAIVSESVAIDYVIAPK